MPAQTLSARHAPGESRRALKFFVVAFAGAFLACSFWMVDALLLSGRADDAHRLFERLLSLRNDVGLLAEEYDTNAKRLVGNFPQAFSHIALVNSAHNLGHASKPAEQRSARNGPD